MFIFFFFSSRRRHTRFDCDWSSDVCSSDLGWQLPGGGVRRGEMPEAAAKRELAEEIGLVASALLSAGVTCGIWDGRRDRVHFFELRLAELPKLQLDNREIIEARLTSPSELHSMVLTRPVTAYLGRPPTGRVATLSGMAHNL